MGLKSLVLLLNKTILKTLIFLKNNFYIFEPKNREVIENDFKASLNFSRLKGTYLGKIHFNIVIIGASENEIEKGSHNFSSLYTVNNRMGQSMSNFPGCT